MSRRWVKAEQGGRFSREPAISALVLIPHRDLAHQFLHWVQCLHATKEFGRVTIPSIAQVLVRGAATPIEMQARAIADDPPHILVGTPQAVMEALKLEQPILPMRELATVVVDEADYMLECPPRLRDKYDMIKYQRMLKKHPSDARQVLDTIYHVQRFSEWHKVKLLKERAALGSGNFLNKSSSGIVKGHLPMIRPQLVFTSATLKATFRHGLLADGKWLTPHEDDLVRVITHAKQEDRAESSFGATTTTHCALVYSRGDGSIVNIKGAVDPPPENAAPALVPVQIDAEPTAYETSPSAIDLQAIEEAVDERKYLSSWYL